MKKSVRLLIMVSFLCTLLPLGAQQVLSYNSEMIHESINRTKDLLSHSLWVEALNEAAYYAVLLPDVGDFLYMQALALVGTHANKSDIIPLLTSALSLPRWLQYGKDSARTVLADMLSDTKNHIGALSLLNETPRISNADADFIRAKTLYRLNRMTEARTIIRDALSLYPFDVRFPLLFCQVQWALPSNADSQRLAQAIVSRLSVWESTHPAILLYASPFINDTDIRTRTIKEYRAVTVQNATTSEDKVFSALLALQNNIITDVEAFGEIKNEQSISFRLFSEFTPFIKTVSVQKDISMWLGTFAGEFVWDTDNDGIMDLQALYKNGRPSQIVYDKNQDGKKEFTVQSDFGVPVSVVLDNTLANNGASEFVSLEYAPYPFVSKAKYTAPRAGVTDYTAVPMTLQWSPITLQKALLAYVDDSFFIPVLPSKQVMLTERDLAKSALYLERSTPERFGARVRINMKNGQPQTAQYVLPNDIEYAHMRYENGLPQLRYVDSNLNGVFDSTEFFAVHPATRDLYISHFTSDQNEDGVIDYQERFFPAGIKAEGIDSDVVKIAEWDVDGNGIWEIYYEKRSTGVEKSTYIHPKTHMSVTIMMQNGKPLSVSTPHATYHIYPDVKKNFYWLNRVPQRGTNFSDRVIQAYTLFGVKGVSSIVSIDNIDVLVVSVGDTYFGEVLND